MLPLLVSAQKPYTLEVIPLDKDTSFFTRDFSYAKSFSDTLNRYRALESWQRSLYRAGYLEVSVERLEYDSLHLKAWVLVGRPWLWAGLRNGNVDEVILQRAGYRERLFDEDPVQPEQVADLMESILTYCENNGYPFATVKLDSLQFEDSRITAAIFLEKNKVITIDSIQLKGDARIAKPYLANYLGFRLPALYREDLVRRASSRIAELPFLSQVQPPVVLFLEDRATLVLALQKKNASRFDFILGILPNSTSSGKLLVTGDGQLNLVNPFGRGESVFIGFSQLRSRTTEAEIKADYPYLFGLPFGIDGRFYLFKNDTLYLDVKEQIGLKYLFTGSSYLKIFYRYAATNILSFDSAQLVSSKKLPAYLDTRTNFYGLEYFFEDLDYRFNPSRGWAVVLKGEAGIRSVSENSGIVQLTDPEDPSFEFGNLYDSLQTDQSQYLFEAGLNRYWEITPRSIFKTAYQGGAVVSDDVFQNELFRLGGFQLLRGFDEESIYASQFHLLTAEYRYLLSRNSFFYLFVDGAYLENNSADPFYRDTPYGFGAGLNFETRAGIFSLSYALGSQQGNPIRFNAAKIHFGYVNYF